MTNSLYIDYMCVYILITCGMVFNKQIQTYETVCNRDLNVSETFPEELF